MGEKNVNVSIGRKDGPERRTLAVLTRKAECRSESEFMRLCYLRFCESVKMYADGKGWNTRKLEKLEKKYPPVSRSCKLPTLDDDDDE